MDNKKSRGRARGIIIVILLVIMAVSGAMSIRGWLEDRRTQEQYESRISSGNGNRA